MGDLISKLSEIRSDYNCFDAGEEPYYRALSEAIKILSKLADGDTISRQAAIDELDKGAWGVEWDKTLAKTMIESLPSAQPEPQWIPWNSGNLPEESGTYAVTAYDGAIKRVTYAKYQKRLKRWELTGARAYWRVLAWMPLPEPWEGEGNERA